MSTHASEVQIGDDVWRGVALGRVVDIDADKYRVRFDRDPDGLPPSEGLYTLDELERAES